MKTYVTMLTWLAGRFILALICYLSHLLLLSDLTGLDIGYLQWIGIILISYCLFPVQYSNLDSRSGAKKNNSESDIIRHGR
jgi:hypothetical protein